MTEQTEAQDACPRCGETLYQGHLCAGWPDRFTASTPPSSAPETRTSDLVDVHVKLDAIHRAMAIRILEDTLYFAKRGDDFAGFSPGYAACYRHGNAAYERNDPLLAASHSPGTPAPAETPDRMAPTRRFVSAIRRALHTPMTDRAFSVTVRDALMELNAGNAALPPLDGPRIVQSVAPTGIAADPDTEALPSEPTQKASPARKAIGALAAELAEIDDALLHVCDDNAEWKVGTLDPDLPRYVRLNENGAPIIDTDDPAEAIRKIGAAWDRLCERYDAKCSELASVRASTGTPDPDLSRWQAGKRPCDCHACSKSEGEYVATCCPRGLTHGPFCNCVSASHSPGTPAPAGGTLTACQRAVYYCMACPLTFPDAASSNAHHDATGHNQTWRPVMAFHARNPAATAASGIGTTEDADCFDELTESAAVNDVLASMARDYPGSVARVVRYLREVKADRDRMDWWEAHLPESIYWKDRGGNLKQGTTMRRFTDAARASVSRDASLPKSAEQQVAARSSTESPQ